MATLIDHKNRSKTHGAVDSLESLMVTAAMHTPHARRLGTSGQIRYAEALVRGAIRNERRTDVGQELILSDDERAAWEASNPLAD